LRSSRAFTDGGALVALLLERCMRAREAPVIAVSAADM
jgi:hypothetical protein